MGGHFFEESIPASDIEVEVGEVLNDILDAIEKADDESNRRTFHTSPSREDRPESESRREKQHNKSMQPQRRVHSTREKHYNPHSSSNYSRKKRRESSFTGINNGGLSLNHISRQRYPISVPNALYNQQQHNYSQRFKFGSNGVDIFFRGAGFWRQGDTSGVVGTGAGGGAEVMPSLSSTATQLITPTLMGQQQKDTTWTKLFVGGLPYHTTDKSLRDHFKVYGEIEEAVVITDRQTGKSRGYGFVIMADRASAERACKEPNPIIDGRKANVNLAILGAKPRGNVAALTAVNNAVAAANAAAALAAASGAFPFNTATSAIHRAAAAAAAAAAATGGVSSVYPVSVASTTNPILAASQYGLTPTAASALMPAAANVTPTVSAAGMIPSAATPASYLYQAAAAHQGNSAHQPQSAAVQQAAAAAAAAAAAYCGSPLLSLQHHPHQTAGISAASPAFAAALAAQQAQASHLQFYDTTAAATAQYHHHHQTQVSAAGPTAGTAAAASATNASANAGLTSAANVVGSGSTGSNHHYTHGTTAATAGHHHPLSAAAQQAFAALAQLDPYSSYLAAAAAASGQNAQNNATTATTPTYGYIPGSVAAATAAAAAGGATGAVHHAVNPYASAT